MAAERFNARDSPLPSHPTVGARGTASPTAHRSPLLPLDATAVVEVVGYTGVPADSLASYGSHYEKP
jgi:hypothetical protein